MTDVLLYQTPDGGEINLIAGDVETTERFDTAIYMSMFAGPAWWGDAGVDASEQQANCQTEAALDTLPPGSKNLQRIKSAVESDLAWFKSSKIVNEIGVDVSIPTLNRVTISVTMTADGKESQFEYTDSWTA